MKITRQPSTTFFPVPVVLVSSQYEGYRPNIITVAWAGVVCSEPPMVGVGIRPDRHSHKLIKNSGEFVVNFPTIEQVKSVDLCGVYSGAEKDKFVLANFTPEPAREVKAPLIAECPVNLECKVRKIISLGSHDLFIGEIVSVQVEEQYLDKHSLVDIKKYKPLAYATPNYWSLGKTLELYGFSKKKN